MRKDKIMPMFQDVLVPMYGDIMPCGGIPIFDPEGETSPYRCDKCGVVIGSIGMPKECKELLEMERFEKVK